ncbi:MAG: SpoIID/LytB domain-containing protein [Actinomycetota bacterium]|nr:SpoIID/LytB domain-containing protein [Actinomycetota bacterium]
MPTRAILTAVLTASGLLAAASSAPARDTQRTSPARAQGSPTFFVVGRGWGHGIGLSQYGAYGFAQHGYRAERIVKHYYAGTTIGLAPLSRVRILLGEGRSRVSIASKEAFAVRDGKGKTHPLDPGTYNVGTSFKVKDDPSGPAKVLQYPLTFVPGLQPLALDGSGYRGSIRLNKRGSSLQVVNVVGLEPYLWGVVPSEMPRDWSQEALKAQAIVARSYAAAHLHSGGGFDLYQDTRSQVYRGIRGEAASSNAAVSATAGKVVLYRGKVANTFFFSTSGGRTASVEDVWPTSSPIPYLKSVADPYDSISPHHTWGPFRITPGALARRLHVPGRLVSVDIAAARSGRVKNVIATGSGGQVTLSGSDVKSALGLRSTWFRIASLLLTPPEEPVVYGLRQTLTGLAGGVRAATLQRRSYGGSWRPAATVRPAGDGTVKRSVAPRISTDYRLYARGVTSALVRLNVSPAVRLFVAGDRSGFYGRVRPLVSGTVQIQRQGASAWRTVASVPVRADGTFESQVYPEAGTYRARVVPGGGFVPGISPILRIVG